MGLAMILEFYYKFNASTLSKIDWHQNRSCGGVQQVPGLTPNFLKFKV